MQWFWLTFVFHVPGLLHCNSLPSCDKQAALKIHGLLSRKWTCILKMPRTGNALNDRPLRIVEGHETAWLSQNTGASQKNCLLNSLDWHGSIQHGYRYKTDAPHRTEIELWMKKGRITIITCSRFYRQWLLEANHPLWVGPTLLEGWLTLPIKWELAKTTQCTSSHYLLYRFMSSRTDCDFHYICNLTVSLYSESFNYNQ
jgi:hypothetical protein